MTHLLDASSLLLMLSKLESQKAPKLLTENAILDLTGYEIGNAIWKQCRIFRTLNEEEAISFISSFRKIMAGMQVFPITDSVMEEVEELALHEEISFYDASYIHAAKRRKIDLVTEDKKLASVASKHVLAISSKDL